jgi:hypothetical protein
MMTLCKMLLNWLTSFVMKTNQSLKNEFYSITIFSKHFLFMFTNQFEYQYDKKMHQFNNHNLKRYFNQTTDELHS